MARVRATSGLSWWLILYSAPRGFSPGSPVFPENHFRVSGASWVNINNYSPRRSLAGFWRTVSRMKRETNDSKVNDLLSFDINILSN